MNQLPPLAPKGLVVPSILPPISSRTGLDRPRPTQRRNHHKTNEWISRQELLNDLFIVQDKSLDDIVDIMRRNGFTASRRQYMKKFKEWGFQKKIKKEDMKILVAKSEKRRIQSGKDTIFFLNGKPLSVERLDRFKGRSFLRDGLMASPSDKTPEGIEYRTPAGPQASPSEKAAIPGTDIGVHFTSSISKITTMEGYHFFDEPSTTRVTHAHRLGRYGLSFTSDRLDEGRSMDILWEAFVLSRDLHGLITRTKEPSVLDKSPSIQHNRSGTPNPQFWIAYYGRNPEILDEAVRDSLILCVQNSIVIKEMLVSADRGPSRLQWKDWTPMTGSVGNNVVAAGQLLFGRNTFFYPEITLIEIFILFGSQSDDKGQSLMRITLGADHRHGPVCPICETRFTTIDFIDATSAIKIQVPLKNKVADPEVLGDITFHETAENAPWTDRLDRLEGWEMFFPCEIREKYSSQPYKCINDSDPIVEQHTWDPTGGSSYEPSFQPSPLNRDFIDHVCSWRQRLGQEKFDPAPVEERKWDPNGVDWAVYDGEFNSDSESDS